MSKYQPTIGLEIHAELATKTKMFCGCKNDPDEDRPNWNICPICLAHPGTLPVINKEAVRQVLRVGVALGGKLALEFSEFDRKNYFYPDIPKGYQISQYKYPLVNGGELNGVKITRIHLEEDTATSKHDRGDFSLVDFNRAGVPLMELVTEPMITSAKQAGDFARELQLLLRCLGVSEANMEKGEMRVEANISIALGGETSKLGTKVEVKNLNSFRVVEKAIDYELKRQQKVLEAGEKVVQETRGWDDNKQVTFSQRQKESSHDYRYFPEPDLPKLKLGEVTEFSVENLTKTLPELPWQKRGRLRGLGFLQDQDVEQLVGDFELSRLFSLVEAELKEPELVKVAANYILNFVAGERKKNPAWLPKTEIVAAVVKNKLPSPQARSSILGGVIAAVASDSGELEKIIDQVIAANPKSVEDYQAGKAVALQFLVGQGMKLSKGAANPAVLQKLLSAKLSA